MPKITQIRIGKHNTGIVGLDSILTEAAGQGMDVQEDDIGKFLVKKVSQQNYIPSNATHLYEAALVREYKKHMGQPVESIPMEGIQIKVLGAGCPSCDRLEQEMMGVIEKAGVEAHLEHVRDFKEISSYGVMGSPALVINGKVKAVGSIPSRTKLLAILQEAILYNTGGQVSSKKQ